MTVLITREEHRALLAALMDDDGCDYGFQSRSFERIEVFPNNPSNVEIWIPDGYDDNDDEYEYEDEYDMVSTTKNEPEMADTSNPTPNIHSDLKVSIDKFHDRDDQLVVEEGRLPP